MTTEPAPPHSVEAERALLGCMLQSPEAIGLVSDVAPTDLYVPAYRVAFEVLRGLHDRREPTDLPAVAVALERTGGAKALALRDETIADLLEASGVWTSIRHYAALVLAFSARRKLIQLAAELGARAARGDDDVADVLADARAALGAVDAPGDDGTVKVGDLHDSGVQRIRAKATEPAKALIKTGIGALDRKIGGFEAKQIVVVGGRPGMGKTALAMTWARSMSKHGVPVLMFSMEMSTQEMFERLVGAEARFPIDALHTGACSREEIQRVWFKGGDLRHAPLWLNDRTQTVGKLVATARAWRSRVRDERAVVVVDYLGLIRFSGRAENRNAEVSAMSAAMKNMANDLECPVVLVAQLNRASEREGRDPMLSDLRDSGSIEQDAHKVIFPVREPPLEASGPARLIIAKNRGGATGVVDCRWHAEFMEFVDAAGDVPEQRNYQDVRE